MAIYLVGGGPESCPTPGLLDGFRDEVAARGGALVVVMVERGRTCSQEHLPGYAALAADGVEVRSVADRRRCDRRSGPSSTAPVASPWPADRRRATTPACTT